MVLNLKGAILILMIIGTSSCDYYIVNQHKNHVGVIDSSFGDDGFKACFEEKIFPNYYGYNRTGYKKGKNALIKHIKEGYDNLGYTSDSGYITFRFLVNCKGEAGRHIVETVGEDYKTKSFNDEYLELLLELIKDLKEWTPLSFYGDQYDSFNYISLKIENGELVEILP